MLLTETVILKWNSKIKKHYVDLGYTYTKMGDEFEVNVKDLTHGSNVRVKVKCDYCGKISDVSWHSYINLKNKELIKNDCCNNPKCTGLKASDAIEFKYGVRNIRSIDGVDKKIKQTNIEKYGCENPFGNKKIQQKIIETNIEKYGVPFTMQCNEVKEKSIKTCISKYGVCNYSKTKEFRESMRGANSPVWKENPVRERTERKLPEYRDWRAFVFKRDNYTCCCCGSKNYKGKGTAVVLNAHHIYNFATHKELALDADNGITLCEKCHMLFHSLYGKKNNTPEQLNNFLKYYKNRYIDENVC